MTFVVTEACIKCKLTDCVEVCPVDCFHEGPNFLVIDPDECIDCGACVTTCPTGIDIRDGLQYECIDCAACVDVCNGVMKKMGYAPDLIRFSSENQDEGVPKARNRLRLLGYGSVLVAMVAVRFFSRAEAQSGRVRRLPDVEVAQRLGAPCGGGRISSRAFREPAGGS